MSSTVPKTCQHCNREFGAFTHNVKRGWGRFCCRRCMYDWRKLQPRTSLPLTIRQLQPGEPVPSGTPRRYRNSQGYIRLRWHVGVRSYVEVYEHRLIAGMPDGVVHHRNERKDDNSPVNLELMSMSAHAEHHHQLSYDVSLAACMYMEGWTLPQLSEYFGKNTGNLNRALRKYGVQMRTISQSKRLVVERGVCPSW